MKAKELRNKNILELRKMVEEIRKKIAQMVIEKSMNKLSKPHLLRIYKKDLARLLTIIKENEKKVNR